MRIAVELDQARLRQLAEQTLGCPVADAELFLDVAPGQRAVLGHVSQCPSLFVAELQLGFSIIGTASVPAVVAAATNRRSILTVDFHDDLLGEVIILVPILSPDKGLLATYFGRRSRNDATRDRAMTMLQELAASSNYGKYTWLARVELAREAMRDGQTEQGQKILKSIPESSGAYYELAQYLLKQYAEGNIPLNTRRNSG